MKLDVYFSINVFNFDIVSLINYVVNVHVNVHVVIVIIIVIVLLKMHLLVVSY